jgi:nascent polypeptide-associated complex subunit alpha
MAATQEPKVEVLDEDEQVPELEETNVEEVEGGEEPEDEAASQSRSEKKARKAMAKLGLKPVADIIRVTIRKSKSILFVVAKPEVLKSPVSDTYIVFGAANIEDMSQNRLSQAADKMVAPEGGDVQPPVAEAAADAAPEAAAAAADDDDDDEEVDASGVEEKDIELVVSQAGVSRGKAIKALVKSGGDIVNAIMELTM